MVQYGPAVLALLCAVWLGSGVAATPNFIFMMVRYSFFAPHALREFSARLRFRHNTLCYLFLIFLGTFALSLLHTMRL